MRTGGTQEVRQLWTILHDDSIVKLRTECPKVDAHLGFVQTRRGRVAGIALSRLMSAEARADHHVTSLMIK